jgi:coenzyme F420-dependent glucose-6-phosphate dehydrogenase
MLRHVQHAEQAGFQAAMCSDHFMPWTERQGHSGFAWSWLGAAMQATSLDFGTVSAPGYRYHPAIIAQAAATLQQMYPGRFWFAAGTGEALNEHITGLPWPARKDERRERLAECVDIMRALWRGGFVSRDGAIRVDEAKLFTLPASPPLLLGAALTVETAEWAGSWADGLITTSRPSDELREMIAAFRSGGGGGKPVAVQATLCYAAEESEARRLAHDQWRALILGGDVLAALRTPAEFTSASQYVREEDVAKVLRVSSDIGRHLDWILGDFDAGADTVYACDVGGNLTSFIDMFGEHVLPHIPR